MQIEVKMLSLVGTSTPPPNLEYFHWLIGTFSLVFNKHQNPYLNEDFNYDLHTASKCSVEFPTKLVARRVPNPKALNGTKALNRKKAHCVTIYSSLNSSLQSFRKCYQTNEMIFSKYYID
jgi:hypothetical protein